MKPIRSELVTRGQTESQRGFSLAEVLAALAITMILVVALAPLVGQVLHTWMRGTEVARAVELKARGLGRLREDLRRSIVWASFGRADTNIAFRGTETAISFPAVTGTGPGGNGLEMIAVSVETSEDGRAIVRRRAPIIGSTHSPFSDPVILFSGRFKYAFRYVGHSGQSLPIWINRTDLPASVKLIVSDQRGPVFNAPIELPVLASLAAGCLVADNLPGCPISPKETDLKKILERGGNVEDEDE